MRRYLVVRCPGCRRFKVAAGSVKTTACPACGKGIRLEGARVEFESEVLEEAQRAIGYLNAKVAGQVDSFVEAGMTPSSAPQQRGSEAERARQAARRLTEKGGTFDEAAFARALGEDGIPPAKATALLQRLQVEAVVVEVRAGAFRYGL